MRPHVQAVGHKKVESPIEVIVGADDRVASTCTLRHCHANRAGRATRSGDDPEYSTSVVFQEYVRNVLHPAAADQEDVLIHVIVEVPGNAAAAMHLRAEIAGDCSIRHTAGQVHQ